MAVLAGSVVMVVAGVGSFHVHDYASSKKKKDIAKISQQTGLTLLIKISQQTGLTLLIKISHQTGLTLLIKISHQTGLTLLIKISQETGLTLLIKFSHNTRGVIHFQIMGCKFERMMPYGVG